jgi:hypothetical protein
MRIPGQLRRSIQFQHPYPHLIDRIATHRTLLVTPPFIVVVTNPQKCPDIQINPLYPQAAQTDSSWYTTFGGESSGFKRDFSSTFQRPISTRTQAVHHQESRIVAIAEHQNLTQSRPVIENPASLRLQQLIDTGTLYVAQNLSSSQFATLQAIAARVLRPNSKDLAASLDSALASDASGGLRFRTQAPPALDYQLGLDELDTLTRIRTGYPFAELPHELQDAILNLIATRDLTTRRLDLARWLEDLHNAAAAL